MSWTSTRWALTTSLLGAIMAGCVIPVDESAKPVESVPADIFTTTTIATTTTEAEPDAPVFDLSLFWQFQDAAGTQRLVRVQRPQEEPPTPVQALEALVAGPNPDESESLAEIGVFFPFTSDVLAPVVGAPNENRIVIVSISPEFGLRENDSAKIPVSQEIVCTLTSLFAVNGVVLEDAQGELALPDIDSETIVGAAASNNYNCGQASDITTLIEQNEEPPEPDDESLESEDSATTDG